MAQHGEATPGHNRYMGHPGEGKSMESQSPGGVRWVSTQRSSSGMGSQSPNRRRRLPCGGKGDGRNGRLVIIQRTDQINKYNKDNRSQVFMEREKTRINLVVLVCN